ncbi:tRNA (adenosine(37)-N6)-threonylcarbamoyltransferase complex dimerization subunit type 1 TsaB [Rhodoferax sp.]|uniref:tRNA (adenosine(37)-N6)-threonylcarbamoyltransferase complex dimerization subunit type 1 TsaB n=1 Tax=Rhodoferax sp. TaxID=50421 RepID=UPI0027623033|nr:tRNA (adenosine(37)-N6)-threonylcarbamoyltransferase complex dimerization subunit type 1 TsaB [Rhodoferax sp.]
MQLLALDTSTETMSIAVQRTLDGQVRVWQHSAPGGAQTSSQLIPAIQHLLAQAGLLIGQLEAIAFGCGPGSFTGLRTACSVAQGLAFGAGIQVLPVDTLLAVAEQARFEHAREAQQLHVLSLLDARMDELYAGHYRYADGHWTQLRDFSLIRPEHLALEPGWLLAGNVWDAYAQRLPAGASTGFKTLPSASAMLRLAPQLLALGAAIDPALALPRYIRDKVAKTSHERAVERERATQEAPPP